MKKIMLILCLTLFSVTSFAKEPKNLTFVKMDLIKYHDSGNYDKEQAAIGNQAMLYLKNRLASEKRLPTGKKFAIVFDIDDTSLSNYADMKHLDFGGTLEDIVKAEDKGNDPAISPTLKLYRYAKENGVAVFFITGRHEKFSESTIRNLKAVGFTDWNGLTLKPATYQEKSVIPYKTAARADIEKQGYLIILNIGDQESDLKGGHAEKTFKLPNPYYFLP